MKCINCAYIMSCNKASKDKQECEKYIKRDAEVRREYERNKI